jgi:hypothetical protein
MKNYDHVWNFKEGYSIVRNNKWGYINREGKEVVKPIYDFVDNFQNDFARVRKDDKYGYINKQGIEVIPLIYDNASQADKELKKYKKRCLMESL